MKGSRLHKTFRALALDPSGLGVGVGAGDVRTQDFCSADDNGFSIRRRSILL